MQRKLSRLTGVGRSRNGYWRLGLRTYSEAYHSVIKSGDRCKTQGWIIGGLAAFSVLSFLLITLPILRRGLKQTGREERSQAKKTLDEGIPAQAVVHSIQPTNATLGNEPVVILELDVRTREGEIKRAVVRTAIYTVHIPKFQEGREVSVKYSEGPQGLAVAVEGAYLP